MIVFTLLCMYTVYANVISLDNGYIYRNVLDFNFNYQGNIQIITNPHDFDFEIGPAVIKFEKIGVGLSSKVKVLDYQRLPELREGPNIKNGITVPRMFDRKFRAAIIRHELNDGPCFSMEAAKNHLHYLNLMLKLLSGYRSIYDEELSFITPQCIPVNSSCYADYGSAHRCGWANAKALNPTMDNIGYSTQIHCFSWYFGWSGLAASSNEDAWLNYGSYWALIQMMSGQGLFGVYGTMAHEVGHNMGHGHASKPGSRFVHQYRNPDGYEDIGNYMGHGRNWYNLPCPSQWMRANNGRQVFTPWIKNCEDGVTKYRVFAWDHPYSRVFLGDEVRITHRENDVIDGIKFKYNTAALIIEYSDKTFNTALAPLNFGSICLEYHWYTDGFESYRNKGIKFTIGDFNTGSDNMRTAAQYLNAEVDDNQGYHASEIPLNYVKVPEVDIGTMKFRITKFHPIKEIDPDSSLLEEFPKHEIKLEDLPYVEVEITHLPNVPFKKPTNMASVPEVLFSPSLINCVYKSNTYECDHFNDFNYWTYIKQGPSRNYTLPRLYSNTNGDDTKYNGRLGMVSYPGISYGNHQIVTGSMDIEVVRRTNFIFRQRGQRFGDITLDYYQQCSLKKMDPVTTTYERYIFPGLESELYDVAVLNKFNKTLFGRVTIRDLYFNDFKIDMINNETTNTGILLFKPHKVQLFNKLFITLESELGVPANQHPIARTYTMPSKRLAVIDFNPLDNSYTVISASLSNRKTSNAFVGPIKIIKNLWYYFPFTDLDVRNYLFIDFEGYVPTNLEIQIETEMGVYKKELGYLSKLEDATAGIQILTLSTNTGGWGEIYRFRFNNDVDLLSMRLSLFSSHGIAIPDGINSVNRTISIGEDKYLLECNSMARDFNFEQFNVTFLGNKLKFDSNDRIYTVVELFPNGMYNIFNIHISLAITILLMLL